MKLNVTMRSSSRVITGPNYNLDHKLASVTNSEEKKLAKTSFIFKQHNQNQNGGEMRYTPAALEQLLHAGLNHLDVLNLSALQLEELDKVRCIGMAQQETVALAHLIKSQKTVANEAAILSGSNLDHVRNQNYFIGAYKKY